MDHHPALRRLLASVRRHECSLAIASQAQDNIIAMIAAGRLAKALRRAAVVLAVLPHGDVAERTALSSMLCESMKRIEGMVVPAATTAHGCDAQRLTRWARAAREASPGCAGPDLFELDGGGIALDGARFAELHLARCRLISSLQGARFADVRIDDCDFTYANLSTAAWRQVWIYRSFLRECRLIDAAFDRVTLIGCDLRGADFSVAHEAALTHDLVFLGCDLRQTNWTGRDLSRVIAIDCRVHQMIGVGPSRPLRVVRADVSAWGNASEMIGLETPALYVGKDAAAAGNAQSGWQTADNDDYS